VISPQLLQIVTECISFIYNDLLHINIVISHIYLSFKNMYLYRMSDNGKIIYNVGPRIHCHWLPKWPGIFDSVSPCCTMEISTSFWHVNDFIPFPPQHFLSNILICLLMYNMATSKHKYIKREEMTGVIVSGNSCHCV